MMEQLSATSKNAKEHISKWLLAYWLGSSITQNKLTNNNLNSILECGQMAFLTLDRAISALHYTDSKTKKKAIKRIKDCQKALLGYYNSHFELLPEKSEQLFEQFKQITSRLNERFLDETSKAIVSKAKSQIINSIDDFLSPKDNNHNRQELPNLVPQKSIGHRLNRLITANNNELRHYPYINGKKEDDDEFVLNSVLIRSNDGVLLDGLHIKKNNSKKKTLVLGLIGHFQSEDYYLAPYAIDYYKLFNTDVVLLNHRNYSQHSGIDAQSIDELSQDVISFVNYYQTKYDNLVLYGMCGGAAHMIHAAYKLHDKGQPVKLIVDRFSTTYSNFFEPKTLTRLNNYLPLHSPYRLINFLITPGYGYPFLLIVLWLIFMVGLILLMTSNTHIDFAALLKNIPEKDLLLLQAKSPRVIGQSEPDFTDYYVHPQNDIRMAYKALRKKEKSKLTNLIKQSEELTFLFDFDDKVSSSFKQLAIDLTTCIAVIDDEKLMLHQSKPSTPTDLHTHRLFQLETRSKTPISSFVQSFFASPTKQWKHKITALKGYDIPSIAQALTNTYGKIHPEIDFDQLAIKFHTLFHDLSINRDSIYCLANQAKNMERSNLEGTLDTLSSSDLFTSLTTSVQSKKTFG